LRTELEQVRRQTAWARREISKNLIDELKPEENDGKVDQVRRVDSLGYLFAAFAFWFLTISLPSSAGLGIIIV